MALSLPVIAVLSRLLDEVLALPAEQRAAWLEGLAPEHREHAERLREMLDPATGMRLGERLQALPAIGADDAVAMAGDAVGAYRLVREIGRGGMGSVWLAERADGAFTRQVALKLPRLAWGAGLAARMAREREIGMRLEHPNIARLYDAGVDERGRPFLALEFVDGKPIDVWCNAQGLGVRERLRLFVQVAKAVAYAHGRLVVHRDIKPSNVLVTADGRAQLLDFGVAKLLSEAGPDALGLTQEQGRVMTPQYASPEQLAGAAVTVQSDVYSLGVLLYELLTGSLPFQPRRASLGAMEDAILQGDAVPASRRVAQRPVAKELRGDVDAILARAMQRDQMRRYASVDSLVQDVERHLQGDTVMARPDGLGYRLGKALRRYWVFATAGTAVLTAVVAGGTVALLQSHRAATQAERARLATEFVSEVFRASARPPDSSGHVGADPLLDQGARLILARFPGQPDMQAELYGVVGRIYSDLGASQSAIEYGRRQLSLLDSLPPDRGRRAAALMLLAEASLEEGQNTDAESYATQATRAVLPEDPQWPDAQMLLARVLSSLGRLQLAADIAQKVEQLLQQQGSRPSAALAWVRWMKAGSHDELQSDQISGIDTALAAEGPGSPTAITMRIARARGLIETNHFAEGRQTLESALSAMHALGGASQIRAALAEGHFWARLYGMQGTSYEEAVAVIERDRAMLALASAPIPARVLARLDFDLAAVHIDHGSIEPGNRLLAGCAPTLLASTQSLGLRWEVVAVQGNLAMLQGQHDAADRLFAERMALRVQMGRGLDPFAAYDWAYRAINLTMKGDYGGAQATLAAAPTFGAQTSDPFGEGYTRVLPYELVRLRLAQGDVAGASKALPALPADAPPDSSTYFGPWALHGEVLCTSGNTGQGLKLLNGSMASNSSFVSPHDPGLARLHAQAGLCAFAAGDRVAAARHAAAARAAFTAQPSVSAYFKAPLARLENLLAQRLASN
jgi:tetratricopeptide (TPR) repeat protein